MNSRKEELASKTIINKRLYRYLGLISRKIPFSGTIVAFIVLLVFFSVKSPYFFSIESFLNIIDYASNIGIAGNMAALLFIAGEFDFSLGVLSSFAGVIFFSLLKAGLSLPVAIIMVLFIGCLIGVVKGILVSFLKLSSFIATLTAMLIIQGASILLVKTKFDGSIIATGTSKTNGYEKYHNFLTGQIEIANFHIGKIACFWILSTIIFTIFLNNTKYGNWYIASGGNSETARLVGMPVKLIKLSAFALSSSMCSYFGILQALRDGSIQANSNLGNETLYMLVAIIGGCALSGGVGSIVGTFIGTLIFAICYQGIVFANLNNDLFNLFLGIAILVSILINNLHKKLMYRKIKIS
jgi:simple sugar transport system permease protein